MLYPYTTLPYIKNGFQLELNMTHAQFLTARRDFVDKLTQAY